MDNNTGDDAVSRPTPDTSDDAKAKRLARMLEVPAAILKIADMINRVQMAMGDDLAQLVTEQPLGAVVDLVADIKDAIGVVHGDGSSVVTNKLKGRLRYISEVTLPERFDHEQVKTFNTEKWRVTKLTKVMASIPADKKEQAFEWLEQNDLGSLIKPTVNASSLSGAAKEIMEKGEELPEELFNVHMQPGISVTKLKPKRG